MEDMFALIISAQIYWDVRNVTHRINVLLVPILHTQLKRQEPQQYATPTLVHQASTKNKFSSE